MKLFRSIIIDLVNTFITDGVGVEIGVRNGMTSELLITRCSVKKLYCIDPWTAEYQDPLVYIGGDLPQWRYDRQCRQVHEMLGKYDQAVILHKKSEDSLDDVPEELDFIFIDGDHTHEGVRKDLELWIPKVRSGGLVIGDDWGEAWPGVISAVTGYIAEYDPFLAPFGSYEKYGFSHEHHVEPEDIPIVNLSQRVWWCLKK